MVALVTVPNGFQAQVLVARLGSAGVLAQPRGGVDGPYPIGAVCVDVDADEIDLARQLLLADEVEAAFTPARSYDDAATPSRRHSVAPWVIVGAAVVTEAVAVASRLA